MEIPIVEDKALYCTLPKDKCRLQVNPLETFSYNEYTTYLLPSRSQGAGNRAYI